MPALASGLGKRICAELRAGNWANYFGSILLPRLKWVGFDTMTGCIAHSDLKEMGDSMIAEYERRIESLPTDLCSAFHQEARNIETQLLVVYKMVALCVRKEPDDNLGVIADWWKIMVDICDAFAVRIAALTEKHPSCGAEVYYDRVLDLRNKCIHSANQQRTDCCPCHALRPL